MACIIKFHNKNSKGVLSITNNEYLNIKNKSDVFNTLKKKWVILYHPNYYDYNFINNGHFDAYLASKDIFRAIDDSSDKILNFSCHNFAPKFFKISKEEKLYDFVGLSKLQTSSGNPKLVKEFLIVVKSAMKLKKISGVLIISIPGRRPGLMNNIRNYYNQLFTDKEKKNFEFITLDYDVPFPLSLKTISMFYRHSKIHLNTHPKERHGRAQAYALACSMPIVGFENLKYLVNKKYRAKPFYFICKNLKDFPNKLIKAIEYYDNNYDYDKHNQLARTFQSKHSFETLKLKLMQKFSLDNSNWRFSDDWDIRLAKHHLGFKTKNSYLQNINEFLNKINKNQFFKDFSEEEDDFYFLKKKNNFFLLTRKIKYFFSLYLKFFKTWIRNLKIKF